jgi:hypothetical protein
MKKQASNPAIETISSNPGARGVAVGFPVVIFGVAAGIGLRVIIGVGVAICVLVTVAVGVSVAFGVLITVAFGVTFVRYWDCAKASGTPI